MNVRKVNQKMYRHVKNLMSNDILVRIELSFWFVPIEFFGFFNVIPPNGGIICVFRSMLKNLKSKTDALQKDKTELTGELNLLENKVKNKNEEIQCLQMKSETLEKVLNYLLQSMTRDAYLARSSLKFFPELWQDERHSVKIKTVRKTHKKL